MNQNRMAGRRVVLVALAALMVAACGGDDGDGGSIPIEDVDARAKAAFCEWIVGCNFLPDQATCLANTTLGLAQMIADVGNGKVTYDGDAAASCLASISGQGCTWTSLISDAGGEAEVCLDVFTGTVAESGACFDDEECAGDYSTCASGTCDPTAQCCAGTCMAGTAPTIVPAGGSCQGTTNVECATGTYCDSSTRVCTTQVAAGGTCSDIDSCATGLFCQVKVSGSTVTRVCGTPAVEGATCDPEIAFGACNRLDNYCDGATLKCTKRKAVGATCTVGQFGDDCMVYAYCMSGTCALRPGPGQSCTTESGCLSAIGGGGCEDGTCPAPEPDTVCP
jgi:hypothetical protein